MMEYLGSMKNLNLVLISIFLSSGLSGFACTQCVLNFLIFPYFNQRIEEKLNKFLSKQKRIELKIVREISIIVDQNVANNEMKSPRSLRKEIKKPNFINKRIVEIKIFK